MSFAKSVGSIRPSISTRRIRAVAIPLARTAEGRRRFIRGGEDADAVLRQIPAELRSASKQSELLRWIAEPVSLGRICDAAIRHLVALPINTPSLRLLLDQTAEALAGMSHALNGLSLQLDLAFALKIPPFSLSDGRRAPWQWQDSLGEPCLTFGVFGIARDGSELINTDVESRRHRTDYNQS